MLLVSAPAISKRFWGDRPMQSNYTKMAIKQKYSSYGGDDGDGR